MSFFIDDATDDRFTGDKIRNMSSERFELPQRYGHKQWAAHHEPHPHRVGEQTVRHASRRHASFVPATIASPHYAAKP
jgi:hypothetical protein